MSERFTPEQQEVYDKEMQRLEAEAGKKDNKAQKAEESDKAATTTSPEKAKAETVDAKTETDAETKARLEKVEKALKDTQRWGHENAAKVKRLEKEAAESKRAATRPAILDANPGLEDAIQHVAGDKKTERQPQEVWLDTVSRAIPDVEQLLGDKDFYARANARKSELGTEWDDPLIAIRELSSLKATHLTNQTVTAAVEAARKDFEVKAKRKGAMEVPGGSGGKDAQNQSDDAVKRYATMSKAEFDKERSRVMGY